MDIRIEKTDRAIEKAFLELRSKMPLEKIKIKDLCALACVNKSTFYAHYEDIYALSSRLETSSLPTFWPVSRRWSCTRSGRSADPRAVPALSRTKRR